MAMTLCESNPLVGTDFLASAVADLQDEARGRWELVTPDAETFWRGHQFLESESRAIQPRQDLPGNRDIVLGFLGRSHLGDAICTSQLPRLLAVTQSRKVYSARLRSVFKVFENNPHLAGYRNEERLPLSDLAYGPGHIIQRLTRAFGCGIDPFPRGELHLSDEELKWAWSVRATLPRNRPVAIVSVGSVTDNIITPSRALGWQEWIQILSRRFTVVQPALTKISCLEESVRVSDAIRANWKPDTIMPDCYVLENLSTRQFFALFAVAELFLGTNSGGTHVAAAMGVPAIVALPRSKYPEPPAFPDQSSGPWGHSAFLYPYHTFLMSPSESAL